MIRIDTYRRLCAALPPDRVVYVTTEGAPELFRQLQGSGRRVVVVSGECDYTVELQQRAHPNADLYKLAASVDWGVLGDYRQGYHSLQVGPACVPERCRPTDTYSLRTDRFTWETFAGLPDEVEHWFVTNLNVEHERMTLLPFGVNNHGPGADVLPEYAGVPKRRRLYVNFQDNTLERVRLKRSYRSGEHALCRDTADLPVRDFYQDMASCQFVLCPAGNGVDCYRVWEALYLGCVPVLKESVFARKLEALGLPVAVVSSLFGLDNYEFLAGAAAYFARHASDRRALEAAYWAHVIGQRTGPSRC